MASALCEEVPEYGRGRSSTDLDDIRGGVERSIELCLRAVGERRRLDDGERAALHFAGGRRADQGVARAAVLDGVKVATRISRRFLMTCGGDDDRPDVLLAAMEEVSQALDWFEDDAGAALSQGHDQVVTQSIPAHHRGAATVVDRLLTSGLRSDEETVSRCREVGIDESRSCHLVVACLLQPGDEKALHDAATALRSTMAVAVGSARHTPRLHVPVVVQPPHSWGWRRLAPALDARGREGSVTVISSPEPFPPALLAGRYSDIQRWLSCVAAAAGGAGLLSALVLRFHWAMFEGTAEDRRRLLQDVLGPVEGLAPRARTELLQTMDTWYELGGSASALARHVGVHKNTLGKRLRRLRDLTGLDVDRPAERLVLETLLRLRHVAADRPVPTASASLIDGRKGPMWCDDTDSEPRSAQAGTRGDEHQKVAGIHVR